MLRVHLHVSNLPHGIVRTELKEMRRGSALFCACGKQVRMMATDLSREFRP